MKDQDDQGADAAAVALAGSSETPQLSHVARLWSQAIGWAGDVCEQFYNPNGCGQCSTCGHLRTDHEPAKRLRETVDALIAAVRAELVDAVKALAAKGYRHWDADEDSKAGKVLSALAGVRGCYPEIDALYAQIVSGNQGASAERAATTRRSEAQKELKQREGK